MLLDNIEQIEDEPWWDVTHWDCWYRLEELGAAINPFKDFAEVDNYYRKLLDISGASAAQIEKIFNDAKQLDDDYADKIVGQVNWLDSYATRLTLTGTRFSGVSG
jgi:hypothetical protein